MKDREEGMWKTKRSPTGQEDEKSVLKKKSTGDRGRQEMKQWDNAGEGKFLS